MPKLFSMLAAGLAAVLAVTVAQTSYLHFVEKAISKPGACLMCQGKGEVTCMTCFGRGESLNLENLSLGIRLDRPPEDIGPKPCKACQGRGKQACKACGN